MNLLAVFWIIIIFIAIISFCIMSVLIILKAYVELRDMLRGMDTKKRYHDQADSGS